MFSLYVYIATHLAAVIRFVFHMTREMLKCVQQAPWGRPQSDFGFGENDFTYLTLHIYFTASRDSNKHIISYHIILCDVTPPIVDTVGPLPTKPQS